VKFKVGGQVHELTKEEVVEVMQGVRPEPVRAHLVELHGTVYPPKQVFATATGRQRQTFTTMEAQRVLRRLGFVCRRTADDDADQTTWDRQEDDPRTKGGAPHDRLAVVEAQLATAMTAIAGLAARVAVLEALSPNGPHSAAGQTT
jgi:hypothetical protein